MLALHSAIVSVNLFKYKEVSIPYINVYVIYFAEIYNFEIRHLVTKQTTGNEYDVTDILYK